MLNKMEQNCLPLLLNILCPLMNPALTWTREYLRKQQEADLGLEMILQFKKASAVRPKWEDVSLCDRTVKSLWAQWDQLEIRDRMLCRRWEGGSGTKGSYQITSARFARGCSSRSRHGKPSRCYQNTWST